MSITSLLDQVTNEAASLRRDVEVTGDRFGCQAADPAKKRACALYVWLLGPTTDQLAVTCPCKP